MDVKTSSRVLIIDNDEAIVRAIVTRLESIGCDCATASNGEEGLHEHSLGDFDLIITDLNMPELDGVGLINRIRASSGIPIIVMTGFSRQYRARLQMIPDVTMLQKPFETQALLDLVRVELSQSGCRLAG